MKGMGSFSFVFVLSLATGPDSSAQLDGIHTPQPVIHKLRPEPRPYCLPSGSGGPGQPFLLDAVTGLCRDRSKPRCDPGFVLSGSTKGWSCKRNLPSLPPGLQPPPVRAAQRKPQTTKAAKARIASPVPSPVSVQISSEIPSPVGCEPENPTAENPTAKYGTCRNLALEYESKWLSDKRAKVAELRRPDQTTTDITRRREEALKNLSPEEYSRARARYRRNEEAIDWSELKARNPDTLSYDEKSRLHAFEAKIIAAEEDTGIFSDWDKKIENARLENEIADLQYGKEFSRNETKGNPLSSTERDGSTPGTTPGHEKGDGDRKQAEAPADHVSDIRNEAREWGGKYGGLDWKSTETMNQVADQAVQGSAAVNAGVMQVKGDESVQKYQNGTQTAEKSQSEMLRVFGEASASQASVEGVAAIGLGLQAVRHLASKGRVNKAEKEAKNTIALEVEAAEKACEAEQIPADSCETAERLRKQIQTVEENRENEHRQQNEYAAKQGIQAAIIAIGAAQKIKQAGIVSEMAPKGSPAPGR
jgi:hypothetical protein